MHLILYLGHYDDNEPSGVAGKGKLPWASCRSQTGTI